MKKLYPFLAILMVLSFAFGFSAPVKAMSGGTWQSGIKLQNLSSTNPATISIDLYTPAGVKDSTISQTANGQPLVAPISGSVEVYLPSYGTINPGSYSAIVSSDQPLGVVVTTTNYDYGIADSYNSMTPATEVYVPNIYHNHNAWSTEIFIQNTTNATVTGSAVLTEPTGSGGCDDGCGTKTVPLSIAANATFSIDTSQPAYADMGHFIGAGKITTSGAVAVVANQTRLVGNGLVQGNVLIQSPGVTAADAGSSVVLPSLYNKFSGANGTWNSGIKLQNTTGSDVTATVTFTADPDMPVFTGTKAVTVLANNSTELYLPGVTLDTPAGAFPSQFKGSAVVTVTSAGALSATVQHTNYTASNGYGVALGFIGFSNGFAKVSLPSLYRWPSGAGIWISGIKVQNVGADTVTVDINLKTDPDVSSWTGAKTGVSILPGKAYELYLGASGNLDGGATVPQPWKGSALVTATGSGQVKIAATVIHTNYGRNVANMYTGVPVP
jgi:hypothetical protein